MSQVHVRNLINDCIWRSLRAFAGVKMSDSDGIPGNTCPETNIYVQVVC